MVNRDKTLDISKTEIGIRLENVRRQLSAHDLQLERDFVSEVNAKGYHIQYYGQVQRMQDEERDLIPIIIKYAPMFERKTAYDSLIKSLGKPGFTEATEFLLSEFKKENIPLVDNQYCSFNTTRRGRASSALLNIKDKRYAEEYLKLVENPETRPDSIYLMELLGKLRYEKAYPILFPFLYSEDLQLQKYAFWSLGHFTNHPETLPAIEEIVANDPGWQQKGTSADWALKRLRKAEEKRRLKEGK